MSQQEESNPEPLKSKVLVIVEVVTPSCYHPPYVRRYGLGIQMTATQQAKIKSRADQAHLAQLLPA